MGEIVVLRHGQTEWSRDGRHTGVTNLPLLADGEKQARAVGAVLAHRSFVEVLVSPLQRARQTAELAGLTPADTDQRLVELDYGVYEGRTTAEISVELGREWSIWRDPPSGGETLEQAGTRVDAVLARVRPRLDDGDVALVAHGHVLRVLTARWLGLSPADGALFALPAGSYGVLGHEHERPVLTGWAMR